MPVYVYHCDNCGFQFEQQQKFSDNPLKKCPECGRNSLHKVYTPVGVIYKGSGFYSTDHRSRSGAVSSSKPKTETKKAEKKSEPVKTAASSEKSSPNKKSD
ncbi:MAG: zinc ribbon domain-containing protein [Anaerolineaceae bacterium]|nr:zinc ribbon domain-containing protein [Anaerolineaceae bacterium]